MILSEKEITKHKINRYLGSKIPKDNRLPSPSGSPGLYLKHIESKTNSYLTIKPDSKSNLELREKGIIVHTNYSNSINLILIPFESLVSINLNKGEEIINPYQFSPFRLLLHLKVPVKYARYVATFREYRIDEFRLIIQSSEYHIEFIASGYQYENIKDFLSRLQLDEKLIISE